ncbi:MAG: hypothetical protein IPL57_00950 [Rubrivivax sp.]|nr:hypothetical protein [Rubrivivax sp.]
MKVKLELYEPAAVVSQAQRQAVDEIAGGQIHRTKAALAETIEEREVKVTRQFVGRAGNQVLQTQRIGYRAAALLQRAQVQRAHAA